MATTITPEEVGLGSPAMRVGRSVAAIAALAVAAVLVASALFLAQGPVEGVARERPIFTTDELEVYRLVEEGVLPASVLEAEPFRTKSLVARGLVPRETLIAAAPPRPPLWCPEERAVMQAVASGVVPPEVLDGEPYRTKRLIARGLVPWESAGPCS
jgi:hypothetical protein